MVTDSPDTVLLDEHPAPRPAPPPPSPVPPPLPPLDALPEREWFERPPFWVAVVVLMLLSIPMLVECSSRRGKAPVPLARPDAAASLPAAAAAASAAPAAVVAPVVAPVAGAEGGRAEGAPPRATPPSVVNPRSNAAEPNKQMVTKCLENGRVIYTQTGACTGSMVPVPIDTDKNLVDSPAPQLNRNVVKPPPVAGSRPSR